MKLLVGIAADGSSDDVLRLAVWLAETMGAGLVVSTVMPELWAIAGGIDREYGSFLRQRADGCLAAAETTVNGRVPAVYVARSAPSIRKGLVAIAAEFEAGIILIGSAAGGPAGRFLEGSLATELLRSSPCPVMICPQGYEPPKAKGIDRVSVAFSGEEGAQKLVEEAAALALSLHASLRITSFVLHDGQMYPSLVGYDAEEMVIRQFRHQLAQSHRLAVANLAPQMKVQTAIGEGKTWEDALSSVGWSGGEFLVVGASSLGAISQVFLGSNATKIVRSSPVPCLLLPRQASPQVKLD